MYTVEYEIEDEKPVIYVFGRDNNGNKTVEKIENFEPYFYILKEEEKKAEILEGVKRTEKTNKTGLEGEEIVKVIVDTPSRVKELRGEFQKTWEGDITFTNRYMIDNYKEIKPSKKRICYLDIETNTDTERPDIKNANHDITAISCYDNFNQKAEVFAWRTDFKKKDEKIVYDFEIKKETKKVETTIHKESSEKKMLKQFTDYINEKDFDILTGWNIEGFDIIYIINRMKNLKMNSSKLSPLRKTKIKAGNWGTIITIKGRVILDMLTCYRKLTAGQMEFYTLDHISEKELNSRKIEMKYTWGKMWREEFDEFIRYNVKDAYLVYEIDRKKKAIDYFDEVRRMAHCHFNDVTMSMKTSDSFILTYCKDKYALPTKIHGNKRKRLKGAMVFDPVRGLHENVIVVDLKSLYPNIIISCNISPETLLTRQEEECVTINNTHYTKKRTGIFPEILQWIFNKRLEMQKERDKHNKGTEEYEALEAKQYAIKIVMNSFYGVTANPYFRLYKEGVGDSITYVGRETVQWSKKVAEENGYEVLYGDTDSIFVKKKTNNPVEEGEKIQNILNNSYSKFLKQFNAPKNTLQVEFEKMYKKLLLFPETKKRYAGLITWYKGKEIEPELSVTGLESKRSDSSKLAKRTQMKVLEMIFEEKTKDEINQYLSKVKQDIKEQKISYEEIGISSPLKKPIASYKAERPSIRAAKYSNKNLGTKYDVGTRFYIMYVKAVPNYPETDVIAFQNNWNVPKGTIINAEKHIEEATGGKIERIYNAVGWEIEKEQKNLNKWF